MILCTPYATAEPRRLTLGSLFTGIGGIDLAFQRAGFNIAFQVEIDDYCNKVLERHWPNVTRHRDVRAVGSGNLPTVDVLAGGFPCQDISAAGKGAGIKEGTRSGLWIEFARIIGEIRPRIVMLENVAAITSRDGTRVIADLTALGYDAEWGIISAADAGASHRRERWWCVAYRQNDGIDRRIGITRDDAQSSAQRPAVAPSGRDGGLFDVADDNCIAGRSRKDSECEAWGKAEISSPEHLSNRRAEVGNPTSSGTPATQQPRQVCSTEQASVGATQSLLGRATNGLSRRLDSARWPARPGQPQHAWEAPRTTTGTANRAARLKALGNAVVPQVAQPIAEAIRAVLETNNTEAGRTTNSEDA
jgi:DNA (cytosine-5)-methyltransferase 1